MWRRGSPDIYGLHSPFLHVSEPLPIDLCFNVEFQIVETGELLQGDPLVIPKGRKGYFSLSPDNRFKLATLREGFIPLKVVLTPSRATALSDPRVTQYFNGTLTSPVLRAKTYWFLQASAAPWLVELQAMAEDLKGQGTASLRAMQWIERLTSIDCYARSIAAFDIAPIPNAVRTPPFPPRGSSSSASVLGGASPRRSHAFTHAAGGAGAQCSSRYRRARSRPSHRGAHARRG